MSKYEPLATYAFMRGLTRMFYDADCTSTF